MRHGETEWSALGRHTSTTDVTLTPRGELQAAAVPGILDRLGIRPAAVLISPRLRARRTAMLAGLAGDVDPDLVEWDYGHYEGRTSEEIATDQPDWSLFDDGAPGGESPPSVAARADRALARAERLLPGGDVVLVCHGHMSRVLAVRWVGLEIAVGRLLAQGPACVTVLSNHRGGGRILEHLNIPPG